MKSTYLENLGLTSGCLAVESLGSSSHPPSDATVSSCIRSAHSYFTAAFQGVTEYMGTWTNLSKIKPVLWKIARLHFLSCPLCFPYLIFPFTPFPPLAFSILLSFFSSQTETTRARRKMFIFLRSMHWASLPLGWWGLRGQCCIHGSIQEPQYGGDTAWHYGVIHPRHAEHNSPLGDRASVKHGEGEEA